MDAASALHPANLRGMYEKQDRLDGMFRGEAVAMNATDLQSNKATGKTKRRFRFFSRRAMRDERGVTLVEFAIIAVPFFLVIFGTFEVGFIFWGTHELENATEDAARAIRTGQFKGGAGLPAFKAEVCSHVVLLKNCTTKLEVDVRTMSSFSQISAVPQPVDAQGKFANTAFVLQTGGPRSLVIVRTFYEWPLLTALTSAVLSNLSDGNRLLTAAAVFRNEAF
jgi:Flp pilus assembly protein TadG